jgi:FkbM family methyltransferase
MAVRPIDRAKVSLMRAPLLFELARRSVLLGRFLARKPHDPDFAAFGQLPLGSGIFLDVGANAGLSALSFRIFDKRTPVVSIEANPHHGRDLNWLRRWLEPFEYRLVAAGDEPGELTLHVPFFRSIPLTGEASAAEHRDEDLAWWTRKHLGTSDSSLLRIESVRVPAVPLDDLALDPAVVKIDVEGHELAVLRGLDATLRRCHPIILIEVSANYDEIVQQLAPYGYGSHYYDRATGRLVPGRGVVNAFFLPR